jgi:acyl-ACP thioesterase
MPPAESAALVAPNIWQAHYAVRSYEVDARGVVSVPSLCNFFQDAASGHAHALGVSVDQLAAENLTWMLYRLTLEIEAECRWRETLTLHTWPSGSQGLFALRDFIFHDRRGRRLGAGFSQWLAIDLGKRRPVRIAPIARRLNPLEGKRAMAHEIADLTSPVLPCHSIPITVGFDDLDINQHVNNVCYVQWVLGTVPLALREKSILRRLEIQFKAEVRAGQRLVARRLGQGTDPLRVDHEIVTAELNGEVVRAATWWRPCGTAPPAPL